MGALDARRLGRGAVGGPAIARASAGSRRSSPAAGSRRRPGRSSCRRTRRPPPGPTSAQLVLGSEGRFGILTEATVRVVPKPRVEARSGVVPRRTGRAPSRPPARSPAPGCRCRWSACRRRSRPRRPSPSPATAAASPALRGVPPAPPDRAGAVPPPRRGERSRAARRDRRPRGRLDRPAPRRDRRRRLGRPAVAAGPLPGAGPARCAVGARLRGRHARDGRRLDAPPRARRRRSVGRSATGSTTDGERVHAFSHLSHVYPSGSSLYATYVFRLARDPDETLDRWRRLKTAASEAIVAPRRHDQPPARRRAGSPAVPGSREGRARAWPCSATSPAGSIRTGC